MGNSMATGMVFINIQDMGHFKKLLLLTMVGNLEEKWICRSCEKGPSNH
jgi:hypothetical protein